MEKNYKAKPIVQGNNPSIDIIVPFYAQYERTCRLIESIHKTVRINYKLILVDDCSPNEHFFKVLQKSNVHVIRNKQQMGFGASLQVGWRNSQSPIMVFIHSDCVVTHGCLDLLIKDLVELKSQKVAMVSARTNYPGEHNEKLLGKRGEVRSAVILEEGFIPFYCVACWREVFNKTGFIRPYFPAGYEDEEFAYRLQYFGFKQAISGTAWIRHDSGATIDALCKTDSSMSALIEKNRDFCLEDLRKLFVKDK